MKTRPLRLSMQFLGPAAMSLANVGQAELGKGEYFKADRKAYWEQLALYHA